AQDFALIDWHRYKLQFCSQARGSSIGYKAEARQDNWRRQALVLSGGTVNGQMAEKVCSSPCRQYSGQMSQDCYDPNRLGFDCRTSRIPRFHTDSKGQPHPEGAALTGLAAHTDCAAVPFHKGFAYSQTETGALRSIGALHLPLFEAVENRLAKLRRDTRSLI